MWKNQYLLAMALCAGALSTTAMGCELIATVDRGLIDDGNGGGGVGGGVGGNAGGDTTNCTDGTKNGDETDVDCGGSCEPCEQGKACTAAEDCESESCADGVCCDTACDKGCDSCTAALKESGEDDGVCGPTKAEAVCAEQACVDSVQTAGSTCDGESEECTAGEATSCETFACDAETNECLTECTEDAHCASCHVCGDDGQCELAAPGTVDRGCAENEACDAAGECKAANGQACEAEEECGTGNCIDGVCCDTVCNNACQACNVEGLAGTCSNVTAGEADTCEEANVCSAAGECKVAPGEDCINDADCASGNCNGLRKCSDFSASDSP
ncbi:hypothetical protein SOCE26_006640 [Sorangium cellulosum]|uniref:Secreted protein n=1 Tax=Sorangium cellulosum TaxID=56 RepID=A0A2L0EJ04_SORCE|nr:hypothetical protein [Sorangium cellulosum]AUX39280.1 hypothetical protein SOCE26_006640 [Sorangium cellulosum]